MPRLLCASVVVLLAGGCAPRVSDRAPQLGTERPSTPRPSAARPAEDSPPVPDDEELPLPPPPSFDRASGDALQRLEFRRGEPLIPVRLMEGTSEVRFSARGRMRMHLPGPVPKDVEAPPGSWWTVKLRESTPARVVAHVQLAELRYGDVEALEQAQALWAERKVPTRVHTIGALYGIAGQVIDNRRKLLLWDRPADSSESAAEAKSRLTTRYGQTLHLFEELAQPASGVLELLDASGGSIGLATGTLEAETLDGAPLDIAQVEYGVGYDFHGFEDRSYRGSLRLTIDRLGRIAVVGLATIEDLLKGLVPAEIFSRAPPEALNAQAVTARGEVLAKLGLKHLTDPYLLCAEQHCAVYKGLSGETPETTTAVEQTRGEALFGSDGHLVDSVYSAVCGGHTEDNDAVWGGPPSPYLRGVSDALIPEGGSAPLPRLPGPAQLAEFLTTELPSACRLTRFAQPTKYRWSKRFTADEVNQRVGPLGIGKVRAIRVEARGVSGRARVLTLEGEKGRTQIRGELNIRRLFGMLNSAMFLVTPEKDKKGRLAAWSFQGGGWGHGVGMCQTGAIGRAEAGWSYRRILQHYFSGAEVLRIY